MSRDPSFPRVGARLVGALRQPFAVDLLREQRTSAWLLAAEKFAQGRCSSEVLEAIRSYEPHVPWQAAYLGQRARCYAEAGDPRAAQARRDLAEFRKSEPKSLEGLTAP